jgi:hypothetical protein
MSALTMRLSRGSLILRPPLLAFAIGALACACAEGGASRPIATPLAGAPGLTTASSAPSAPSLDSITRCAIAADAVTWSPGLAVRSPSGAAFGFLYTATDVRFAPEPTKTLLASASGVRLRLAPWPLDLPLYPRRSLLFAGVVRAGAATRLVWVPGSSGATLTVKLPADDRVEWLRPAPLALAACTELALAPHPPSAQGAPAATTTATEAASLRSLDLSVAVPIAASAGGPAIARLKAPYAQTVILLAEEGPFARVDWAPKGGELAGAHVIGWVARGSLGAPRLGRMPRRGCVLSVGYSFDAPGCQHAHPLWLRAANGLEPIGTVLAQSRVRVTETFSPWVAVEVLAPVKDRASDRLWLDEGATFVMREADVGDCQ